MPWRFMKALAKSLELSSCAASLVGPKIFRPRERNRLTMPAASGASGPTRVRATPSATTKSASAAGSRISRLTRRSSRAVPPLPGATKTVWTRSDWTSFQDRACSRPPEPTTRIFIRARSYLVATGDPAGAPAGFQQFDGCCLLVDDSVGVDILDVVQVFQRVEDFLHLDGVFAGQHGLVVRLHDDFRDLGLEAGLFQRFLHAGVGERVAQHFEAAFLVLHHVVGAGFECGFHQPVL